MNDLLNASLGDALAAVAPDLSDADVDAWADALAPAMGAAGITTPRRAAAFLGQVAEESGGFSTLTEDLTYTAQRMCQVWPARFPCVAAATPYAGNPQRLACHVYAGRLGNGVEATGDGWTYRGRGLIQLTGRALYEQFGASCSRTAEQAAAYLETKEGAAASATWYWSLRKLNPLADTWSITAITRMVNGGTTNLADRIRLSNAALRTLSASTHTA